MEWEDDIPGGEYRGKNKQYSLAPYMNRRSWANEKASHWLSSHELLSVRRDGVIVFRFGIAQEATVKPVEFSIMLHQGVIDNATIDHAPIVWVVMSQSILNAVTLEYSSFAEMSDIDDSGHASFPPPVLLAAHSGSLDDGSIWDGPSITTSNYRGRYCRVPRTSGGFDYYYFNEGVNAEGERKYVWLPVRVASLDTPSTAEIRGVECDIYTVTIDVQDLYRPLDIEYSEGNRYGLCLAETGRHEANWDASFIVEGSLAERLFDRTEMNTRTAGEKAIFEDEFVTGGQLEAGNGIQIRFRDENGLLTGLPLHPVDPDPEVQRQKAFNLVIDSQNESYFVISDRDRETRIDMAESLILDGTGAAIVRVSDQDIVEINVPLRISVDGVPSHPGDNTVEVDFKNSSTLAAEPSLQPVNFEILDDGIAEWSAEGFLHHPLLPKRRKIGVKAWTKESRIDVFENQNQINTDAVRRIDYDDAPTSQGYVPVEWSVDETALGEVRVRGSVRNEELVKPALRCQWSSQLFNEVPDFPNATAICNRFDCKRSQIVSPFGLRHANANLDGYGHASVVTSGPNDFELIEGPAVEPGLPNLNGGALAVETAGRYLISVDMYGAHAPQFQEKASQANRYFEQQLHLLVYDASLDGGTWLWYAHLGSYHFHQRTWSAGAVPPDMLTLPWSLQGSCFVDLQHGDRVTFYRSAKSWPDALPNHLDNNTREFHLRSMSFNMTWHDSGSGDISRSTPLNATAIDTTANTTPSFWDMGLNSPPKYF